MVLYCPASFSLKDKRKFIRSLLDRARDNLNVAAAEVDHQDRHRLSRLAFGTVSSSRAHAERELDHLETMVGEDTALQIREIDRSIA